MSRDATSGQVNPTVVAASQEVGLSRWSMAIVIGYSLSLLLVKLMAIGTASKGVPPAPVARVEVKRGWKSSTILRHLQHAGVLRDDFIPLLFLSALINTPQGALATGLSLFPLTAPVASSVTEAGTSNSTRCGSYTRNMRMASSPLS